MFRSQVRFGLRSGRFPLKKQLKHPRCITLGVLAFAATVAAQATPLDPAPFVASIYADGREGVVWAQWLDGARRREWFSSALTTLWAKCDDRARETKDELGAVDFRHRDEFARAGSQEIYSQDALARDPARERCRGAHARQLVA